MVATFFRTVTSLMLLLAIVCSSLALPQVENQFNTGKTRKQSYPAIFLDQAERYSVAWDIDPDQQLVTFKLVIQTQGYVGFGISKQGTMLGADIVAAEVDIDGEIIFTDFYGETGGIKPIIDDQQDWALASSSRDGIFTRLEFSRKYDTDDSTGDVIIQDEDTYFIWAISRNENPMLDEYHGSAGNGARGAYKVNILNPGFEEPSTALPTTTEPTTAQPTTTVEPTTTTESYPAIFLDAAERYSVAWDLDPEQELVTFTLAVQTQGYVGFGISTEGTMMGADIVAAEVDIDGTIIFTDFYGETGGVKPIVDDQQDWTLVSSSRDGIFTHLKFSRKYATGDLTGDVIIQDEDTYFIWAISRNENPMLDEYHGSAGNGARGAYKVNILNPGFEEPSTALPTTAEPTTAEPITAEPTTAEPTTAEPTTAEPTTAEPTTAEPTTAEPGTDEPTTAEPATDEPTTAEPGTDEPTTAEPTTAEPATGETVPTTSEKPVDPETPSTTPSSAEFLLPSTAISLCMGIFTLVTYNFM